MPSLFRGVIKRKRKKQKSRSVDSSTVAFNGISSADAKKISPSGHHHQGNHGESTKQMNRPQEDGLLREWAYDQHNNIETTGSSRALCAQNSEGSTKNKGRSSTVDCTGRFIQNGAQWNHHQRFKPFRQKAMKKIVGSRTPDTVVSQCSTSTVRRKNACGTMRNSCSSEDDTRPTPIQINFDQEVSNPKDPTTQSTIRFRESTNDPLEEGKEEQSEQPPVTVPTASKGMNATLQKGHSTKTIIMNGDIVVCNSYSSKSTNDSLTVTSSASSVSKAKAIRRESTRNARAAAALDEKGNELFELGQFDKAMACYTKALKLKRRTFAHFIEDAEDVEDELLVRNKDGEDITDPQALVSMATSINNIGYLRQRSGDATPEETMAAYKKSLRIKRRILGNDSLSVGKTLNNIGSVHYLKRDFDRALPAYDEALEIMKANLGDNHPDVATVMSNIGDVYLAQGNKESSLKYYRMALAIRWEAFGGKSPRVVRLLEKISNLEMGNGMMLAKMNKVNHNALASWGDDVASELMVGSGFQPIEKELKDLQEAVQQDIEEVDEKERRATSEMLKDKIIIIRGMRDVWNEGSELLDNDSISVLTARSRISNL